MTGVLGLVPHPYNKRKGEYVNELHPRNLYRRTGFGVMLMNVNVRDRSDTADNLLPLLVLFQ